MNQLEDAYTEATAVRYYDAVRNRLVRVMQAATPGFWDSMWNSVTDLRTMVTATTRHYFVPATTRRFMKPSDGTILEGGCGTGVAMWALQREGYAVKGIDFAPNTIQRIKEVVPELDVVLGDIRNLDFPDGSFAAYWSLGVIEHFYHGYDEILHEAHRVLQIGGLMFITFPHMSPLRTLKVKAGRFQKLANREQEPDGFYEFQLDRKTVLADLAKLGFTPLHVGALGGVKGVVDELPSMGKMFEPVIRNRSLPARAIVYGLTKLLAPVGGHTALIVVRKDR